MTPRESCLAQIAQAIKSSTSDHPLRVGIDGFSCSGKTVLADELGALLGNEGFHVVRANLDGYHNPPAIRYRQGPLNPIGYYEDSFNYKQLTQDLLAPLMPNGSRMIRQHHFDFLKEEENQAQLREVPPNTILIFEGVMLFRPELNRYWDFKIYLDAPEDVIMQRALVRDLEQFGNEENLRAKYMKRYLPGQQYHQSKNTPDKVADSVVDNTDYLNPTLTQ